MPSPHRSVLLLLVTTFLGLAEDTPPISVTLNAKAAIYQSLGEAVLEIQITNTSGHPLTVRTTDADPPIALMALYQNGEPAIISPPIGKNRKTRNIDYELDPLGVPVQEFSATGTFEEVLRELAIQLRSNVVFGFLKQEGPNPKVTVVFDQATTGEVLAKMCDQDTRYKLAVTKSPHVIDIVPTDDNARGMNLLRLRVARFDSVTDDWPQNLFMRLPEFSAEIQAYLAAWYTRESRQTEPLGSPGASMSTNVHPPHVVLHFEDSTFIEILNALSEWIFERASVPDPTLPQGVKIWQLGWKCEVPPVGRSSLDFWSHSIFSGSPN